MKVLFSRAAWLSACVSMLLAACGGGGDGDGDNGGGGPSNGGSEVPASALASIDGLNTYVKGLIANKTDNTSAPVALGDISLPTSSTNEPLK
jgi:hypothetical protein